MAICTVFTLGHHRRSDGFIVVGHGWRIRQPRICFSHLHTVTYVKQGESSRTSYGSWMIMVVMQFRQTEVELEDYSNFETLLN